MNHFHNHPSYPLENYEEISLSLKQKKEVTKIILQDQQNPNFSHRFLVRSIYSSHSHILTGIRHLCIDGEHLAFLIDLAWENDLLLYLRQNLLHMCPSWWWSCLSALAIVAVGKLRLSFKLLPILLQFHGYSHTHFLSLSHFKVLKSDWRQSDEFTEAGVLCIYAHGSFSPNCGRNLFWVHFTGFIILSQSKT